MTASGIVQRNRFPPGRASESCFRVTMGGGLSSSGGPASFAHEFATAEDVIDVAEASGARLQQQGRQQARHAARLKSWWTSWQRKSSDGSFRGAQVVSVVEFVSPGRPPGRRAVPANDSIGAAGRVRATNDGPARSDYAAVTVRLPTRRSHQRAVSRRGRLARSSARSGSARGRRAERGAPFVRRSIWHPARALMPPTSPTRASDHIRTW